MGMVAARAHQIGSMMSASIPSTVKQVQKIFRSIGHFSSGFPFPRQTYKKVQWIVRSVRLKRWPIS